MFISIQFYGFLLLLKKNKNKVKHIQKSKNQLKLIKYPKKKVKIVDYVSYHFFLKSLYHMFLLFFKNCNNNGGDLIFDRKLRNYPALKLNIILSLQRKKRSF